MEFCVAHILMMRYQLFLAIQIFSLIFLISNSFSEKDFLFKVILSSKFLLMILVIELILAYAY